MLVSFCGRASLGKLGSPLINTQQFSILLFILCKSYPLGRCSCPKPKFHLVVTSCGFLPSLTQHTMQTVLSLSQLSCLEQQSWEMAELGCKPWFSSSKVQSPEVLLGLLYCGAACLFAQTVHCVDTSGCKGYWGALGEAALGSVSLAVSQGVLSYPASPWSSLPQFSAQSLVSSPKGGSTSLCCLLTLGPQPFWSRIPALLVHSSSRVPSFLKVTYKSLGLCPCSEDLGTLLRSPKIGSKTSGEMSGLFLSSSTEGKHQGERASLKGSKGRTWRESVLVRARVFSHCSCSS